MLQISGLYIYPIKSLPGISVTEALVTPTGFQHDRRWMLIDENNIFISQRESAEMTQLLVSIEADGLIVTHKTKGSLLKIRFTPPPGNGFVEVWVWEDACQAQFVSVEADQWFTAMLGINCRLVYMPDETRRFVDQHYAPGDHITSFADAYPFLTISEASLDNLNSRLAVPLPMNRFRPNIVFKGGEPYGEDTMGSFTIRDIKFSGVKLCARCPIPTINQSDGSKGNEPLKTLAKYRQKNNKIYFGQNLVHHGDGIIAVGDLLENITLTRDERFIVNQPV
jgi:uncharacterized protein YcbX